MCPLPFVRFDHVQLAMPAGCEDAARAFYRDVLGMTEIPKPLDLAARGGVWFASGALQLHLGVDPAFVPARKAHAALGCADFDGLVSALEGAGFVVTSAGTFEDGVRHAYADDPFGNRLELVDARGATRFDGLDHIDLRVRDLERGRAFYGALLPALGLRVRVDGERASEWYEPSPEGSSRRFFGIHADATHEADASRAAFRVASRERVDQVAKVVRAAGARAIEGPEDAYNHEPYYALFFEDADGNRLEVCYRPGSIAFPPQRS